MAVVFLLLKQDSLILITKVNQLPPLVFPKTVVNHQEIIDSKGFESILQDFFTHYPKLDATVFLLNEIVYEKAIPVTKEMVLEEEVTKFIESIPFPQAKVEKRVIQTKSTAYVYATNSELYKTIAAKAQENGWQIKNVLPMSLYSQFLQGKEISYNSLLQITKQKAHIKEGNFLLQPAVNKPAKQLPVKQLLMLGICLIALGTAVWFALDNLGVIPKSTSSKPSASPNITSPTPQPAQPSPSLEPSPAVQKEQIAIQVFNGSGIAGQATNVRNQLNAIGFTNVQTGNTSVSTSSATTVSFAASVPVAFRNAIVTELQTTFENVITEKTPLTNNYDVSITTGRE